MPRYIEDRCLVVRSLYFPYCGRNYTTFFLPVINSIKQIDMEYNINKGIGKSVDFKGLKAPCLFIFAAGLLAVFIVFVVMYMAGVDQWMCIGFDVIAISVLVWLTFNLNAKYEEHVLMKLMAVKQHPRYLINREIPRRLFKKKRKEVANA